MKIAEELKIRIALPRALDKCSSRPGLCWVMDSKERVVKSLEEAKKQSKECLIQQNKIGVLGFSNGGFLVSKVFQYCLPTGFQFFYQLWWSGDRAIGGSKQSVQVWSYDFNDRKI
jgi:hypothetical protein